MKHHGGGCKSHQFLQCKLVSTQRQPAIASHSESIDAEIMTEIYEKAKPFVDPKQTEKLTRILSLLISSALHIKTYEMILNYKAKEGSSELVSAVLDMMVNARDPENILSGIRMKYNTRFIPSLVEKILLGVPLPKKGPFGVPGKLNAVFSSKNSFLGVNHLMAKPLFFPIVFRKDQIKKILTKAGYPEGYPLAQIQEDFHLPFSLQNAPICHHWLILRDIVNTLKDPEKDYIKIEPTDTPNTDQITFKNGSVTQVKIKYLKQTGNEKSPFVPVGFYEQPDFIALESYLNTSGTWETRIDMKLHKVVVR